jgi:hypothetical protein
MTVSQHPKIRKLLHNFNDGLTTKEIANELSMDNENIRKSLKEMPDTYIDRWTKAHQKKPSQAVWCAVIPPNDCPRPGSK